MKQIAESIANKYKIPMNFEMIRVVNRDFSAFCGNSKDGDKICVIDSPTEPDVRLYIGTMGAGKMEF